MTDKSPPFPTSTVGRIPTVVVNVKLPREFPLRLLAALFARAGRLKWVHRPPAQIETPEPAVTTEIAG